MDKYRETIARRCDELLNSRVDWDTVLVQVGVEFDIKNSQFIMDCYDEWIEGE